MPRSRRRFAAATLCAVASFLVPGAASAGVVVAASGPSAESFPLGRTIAESEPIVLREGDSLTVLAGHDAHLLSGAGTHSLARKTGQGKRGAFAELTARRPVSGAGARGDEASPRTPNLWYVDVDRPGPMCVADTGRVRLWRSASEGDTTYVISGAESGATQTVRFADGETLTAWDTRAVPVSAGALYRLGDGDGVVVTEMSFAVIEPADEPERLAGQLIEHGCAGQLELMTSALTGDEN